VVILLPNALYYFVRKAYSAGMSLQIEVFSGPDITPFIPEIARLRTKVFAEWPYLYQGDLDYEHRYLSKFLDLPEATLAIVQNGQHIIGMSTALPLSHTELELQEPFIQAKLRPSDWYYFSESVLEKSFRGQGLGVKFFHLREDRARQLGYHKTTFCGVERPAAHPLKDPHYVSLDAFWANRGYQKRPDLIAQFSWRDQNQTQDTPKPMVFWTKESI
jgi:GNAT superfamily N-acetyltransferase